MTDDTSDCALGGGRVWRHNRGAAWSRIGPLVVALTMVGSPALAAPIQGVGQGKASETKKPSLSRARARALRRARRAALEAALGEVTGPVDAASRKAVLKSAEAWTGAYRILSESNDGEQVDIQIEVEIDLVRLTKRVRKREASAGRPMFRLDAIEAAPACGELDRVSQTVRDDLVALEGAVLEGKGAPLSIAVDCQVLGPVQFTYLQAVRVQVVASSDGRPVATHNRPAFATTPDEALAAGLRRSLDDLADSLAVHRRGHVRVHVEAPYPAARVRRLETAMRNSVLGVDGVSVAGIEPGIVELHVRGNLAARDLATRLQSLTLPGFSLSIVDVDPPDALTIRLE
ncbi:MAG: hypothetical protein AAF799_39540 [Myxococcota bacterium]